MPCWRNAHGTRTDDSPHDGRARRWSRRRDGESHQMPTSALSVNVAGRFNSAQIGIKTVTGTSLTGTHAYDAGLRFTSERWTTWINYSFTDATFQSSFVESSPNNPGA